MISTKRLVWSPRDWQQRAVFLHHAVAD